jgi:hypothetical protein
MDTPMIAEYRRESKPGRRAWITRLLIGLLTCVIAFHSWPPVAAQDGESTVNALRDAGLLHPLGNSQSAAGVTLTVDWGYADLNQIALGYTVSGLDFPADRAADLGFYAFQVSLSDSRGGRFQEGADGRDWVVGPNSRGDVAGTLLRSSDAVRTDSTLPQPGYLRSEYGLPLPATLALTLQVEIVPAQAGNGPANESRIGPFSVGLVVPLLSGAMLLPRETQRYNGSALTLESLLITPAQTRARVCFDLPDSGDWYPEAGLTLNGDPANLTSWGMTQWPTPDDIHRCFDLRFSPAYYGQPAQLVLTIERLRGAEPDTREYWEAIQRELARHGIQIDLILSGGIAYELVAIPEVMTELELAEIVQTTRENLRPTVEGPWHFDLTLP